MTMAGANPSLTVGILADTSGLGTGLAQAEAQVSQSANRIGSSVDAISRKWSKGIEGMFLKFAGPMFALQAADTFARSFGDALSKNQSFFSAIENALYSIANTIPVVGAVYEQRRLRTRTKFGLSLDEIIFDYIVKNQVPVPEMLGGGTFQFGRGGAGFQPATDPRMRAANLEQRIERLTAQLGTSAAKTREELFAEQIGRMGPDVASVQTAIGTYRIAQDSASAQAKMVDAVNKQVDIMLRIQEATEELKKLQFTN